MTYMDNELKFSKNAPKKYIFKIIYIYIEKVEQKSWNVHGILFFYAKVYIWEI